MNYEIITLPIKSILTDILPNSFFKLNQLSNHLTIIFPGMSYNCSSPILYYSSQVMMEIGSDVLNVNYNYHDLLNKSEEERFKIIKGDGLAALTLAFQQREYSKVTLIGKSLGTRVIALLLEEMSLLDLTPDLRIIWLTPVWNDERHFKAMLELKGSSLHVIGTDDPYYSDTLYNKLLLKKHIEVLVFKGADHSLDVDGNTDLSLTYLTQLVSKIKNFHLPI